MKRTGRKGKVEEFRVEFNFADTILQIIRPIIDIFSITKQYGVEREREKNCAFSFRARLIFVFNVRSNRSRIKY